MVEAAYRHHGVDARYLNCEVAPKALSDAVRGALLTGLLDVLVTDLTCARHALR